MPRRDVRAEVLIAAEQVINEHGVAGVTTKEVARVAGCSQGSIYNHFEDRSDLLAQLAAERVIGVAEAIEQLATENDDLPLSAIVGAVVDGYQQLIALSTSLVADLELRGRFQAVLEDRDATPETIDRAVATLVQAAQNRGRLRTDVDPQAVAFIVSGVCHQVAMARLLHAHQDFTTDDHERAITATLEALLRG